MTKWKNNFSAEELFCRKIILPIKTSRPQEFFRSNTIKVNHVAAVLFLPMWALLFLKLEYLLKT